MKFEIKDEHVRRLKDMKTRAIHVAFIAAFVGLLLMCVSGCTAPQEKPTPIKQIKQTLDCFNYCYA